MSDPERQRARRLLIGIDYAKDPVTYVVEALAAEREIAHAEDRAMQEALRMAWPLPEPRRTL